jgi:hypothetical protein
VYVLLFFLEKKKYKIKRRFDVAITEDPWVIIERRGGLRKEE